MQLSSLLLAGAALAAAGTPPLAQAASVTPRQHSNTIYYCERWTVDRSFIQAPGWMTWNVEIWNTTGKTGNGDLVELVTTDFKGTSFTWVPDLPANSTVRLRLTPNDPTGMNSLFSVSFEASIQPTMKRCDQSKLNLTYSPASVLAVEEPVKGSDATPPLALTVGWAAAAAFGGIGILSALI